MHHTPSPRPGTHTPDFIPHSVKSTVTQEQAQRHCLDVQAQESSWHRQKLLRKYLLIVMDSGTEAEGNRLLRGLPWPGGLASTLGKAGRGKLQSAT